MSILKNHTIDYEKEYIRLQDMQHFDPSLLDYGILDRHIENLSRMASISACGISVFDMYRRRHVFASYNFSELFRYDMRRIEQEDKAYFALKIHPDDLAPLHRNGTIGLRFFLENRTEKLNHKLVSEYRIDIDGRYTRVIEQMQVLETDPLGNAWLSLSVLDISPNQGPLDRVETKIMNFKTGEVLPLPSYPEYEERSVTLTVREKDVLRYVRDGLLSKEISERMGISVNTVNTYRQRIIEKLGAGNSMEALRQASRLGLLD